MADKIGELEYDLRVSDEQFEKDLKKLNEKLKKHGAQMEKSLTISAKTNITAATKQLQGQFQESIKGIGRTNDGLKSMNAYYKDLEKTSKAAAKSTEKASRLETAALKKEAQMAIKAESAINRKIRLRDKAITAAERATKAEERANAAAAKKVSNINKANSAYKKQSLYLQNIRTAAASYVSLFAAVGILNNIRRVTGEFELQNKALAAIIQNKDKADQLFAQVTDLALESPFGIRELLSYTKQLAAYRIENEELIPTLTKLADVSAGLGVDMNRLILAYGQVRAASVLRGCFGLNTPVLKIDKTVIPVQDIKKGDVLIGDDNTNRNVLETIKGREQMYWIKQSNADNYRVNHNHIMTLLKDGQLVDIYLYELLNKDISEYKGVNAINGNISDIEIEKDTIDDYYGFVIDGNKRFLLGDGSIAHNTELRQFTEAGIPMVALLADKFTELEGTAVSTADVFDRISNRAVSFKVVSEIFNDMTAKGGTFFEAQKVQAETLYGMWNILGDAMDKMYNQIGQANLGVLKDGVKGAIDLARNWETVVDVLKAAVLTFGAYKTAMMVNLVIRKSLRNMTLSEIQALKAADAIQKKRIITMNLASVAGKKLTGVMKKLYAIKGTLAIAGFALLAEYLYTSYENSQKLTRELDKLASEGVVKVGDLVSNFKELAKAALEANDGSNNQREAIAELKRTYKDYLPMQKFTIENLKEMSGNYDSVTEAINRKVEAQIKEKTQTAIDTEFNEKKQDALGTISESLVGFPVKGGTEKLTQKQAAFIAKTFRNQLESELKKGLDTNPYGILLQTIEEFDYAGSANARIQYGFDEVRRSTYAYRDALQELSKAESDRDTKLDAAFGFTDVRAKDFKALTKISEDYEKTIREINAKPLTDDAFQVETLEAKKDKLKNIISYYTELANKADGFDKKLFEKDKVKQYTQELNKLTVNIKSYAKEVNDIIKANQGDTTFGQVFAVGEDEDPIEHGKKTAKAYKELILDIKATEGIIKGLKDGGEDILAQTKILKILEIKSVVAKAIIDAMNTSLSKNGAKSDGNISNLRAELDLLKKIKKSREDLSKIMTTEDVEANIQKLFGGQAKDLNIKIPISSDSSAFYEQLENLAVRAENLGGKAGISWAKGLRNQIGTMQVDDIKETAIRALKALDIEVAKYKGKYKFYKDVLGITGNDELAVKLAFEGTESATNFIDTLKKKIEDLAHSGDFNINPNLDFEGIKKLDNLPEKLAKAIKKVDDTITKESTNTLLKRLKFLETKTPEGMGLAFDFSDVITDTSKSAAKIRREIESIVKDASKQDITRINQIGDLQLKSISEQARQRIEKMGAAYTKERIEIAGLGESYSNMTNASLTDINKIIELIKKGQQDLLSGEGLQNMINSLKLDSDVSDSLFGDIFNSSNIDDFVSKVNDLEVEMKNASNVKIGTKVVSEEQILKIQEFITLLKAMGLANKNALDTTTEKKIKKQIAEWRQFNNSLTDVIGTVRDLGSTMGESLSEEGERALNAIQGVSTGIMTAISETSKLAVDGISAVEKASVILAVISASLKIIQGISEAIDTLNNKDITAQQEQTKQVADRINMEMAINKIIRDRNKLQEESIILGKDAGKSMGEAFSLMDESTAEFDEAIKSLSENAIFSDEESWRNLWGFGSKRSKEFSFSIKDILGEKGSGGGSVLDWWFTGVFDKLDLFGKAGKGEAKGKAYESIINTMKESLGAIGKTTEDLLDMSSAEWLDFFRLMKEGGKITDEATLGLIANAEEAQAKYAEAMENVKEIILSITGDLGNQLGDTLADAFERGIDGAEEFKHVVEGMIEDLLKKQLVNTLFKKDFDALEKQMQDSMRIGGDGSWIDDIETFFTNIEGKSEEANKLFEQFRREGKAKGFDLFGGDGGDLGNLAKGITGVTEDTARELAGMLNSIRESVILQGADIKHISGTLNNMYIIQGQSLTNLIEINQNTGAMKNAIESVLGQGSKGTAIKVIIE